MLHVHEYNNKVFSLVYYGTLELRDWHLPMKLPGEMVNYPLTAPFLCTTYLVIPFPRAQNCHTASILNWQPNKKSQKCPNEKRLEPWLIRGTPPPNAIAYKPSCKLSVNSMMQFGQGWDNVSEIEVGSCFYFYIYIYLSGCLTMGDLSNCLSPIVTSEERGCERNTSQGKWENVGFKYGK